MEVLCFAAGMVVGLLVNGRRGEPYGSHRPAEEAGDKVGDDYLQRVQRQLSAMQRYDGMPQEDDYAE